MSDKPSRNEDEYFAREDAERIRKLREKEAAERTAAERKASLMKCPKCGAGLQTETLHEIQIDRCPECHGIWLDDGEMEALMRHEDPGTFRRIMGDLWGSLRKERPRK